MRVPFRWLQDFVKVDFTPEELCQHLIMLGFSDATVVPNQWDVLSGFVAGRILEVKPHPTETNLKIAKVNVGYRNLKSVCGAPNLFQGKVYAVALPGAKLASGMRVEKMTLGGVESECILCSGWEAWIDDSREELLELEDETAPGTRLIEALGLDEPVIEMEVTPNRPDCLGLIGIAREIAAAFGKELLIPEPGLLENGSRIDELISVEVEDQGGCPRYGAVVCEGVKVRRSAATLRARMLLAGLRPINNIVDTTNLVLFETGHPLHAFDLDKICGKKIIVRRARQGESIIGIDGKKYDLSVEDLVIADVEKPVAIAGVIGGENSQVDFNTRNILIEGAFFDHRLIRKTSKRLELTTEASYRFERGTDIGAILYVLARASAIIQRMTKCAVARGRIDVYPNPAGPTRFVVSPKRINALLGTSIPEQEICDYLERLGFLVSPGRELEVIVPSRRVDVECEADIAEEVARLYGYDRIDERTSISCETYARIPREIALKRRIRELLQGMGLNEVVTESMFGPTAVDTFEIGEENVVRIKNPIGVETSFLRFNLLPGITQVVVRNLQRGEKSVGVYEIGRVFSRDNEKFVERDAIGMGLCGMRTPRTWYSPLSEFDFYDLKGIVESLLGELRVEFRIGETKLRWSHPGRSAEILSVGEKPTRLGIIGELSPAIAERLDIKARMYYCEIDFSVLLKLVPQGKQYVEPPKFPALRRDIAVVVREDVREGDVRKVILEEAGGLVTSIDLFDIYRGKQIPDGTKSLAYTLVFQSDERTLTDGEVEAIQKKIEERLSTCFGARLRTKG